DADDRAAATIDAVLAGGELMSDASAIIACPNCATRTASGLPRPASRAAASAMRRSRGSVRGPRAGQQELLTHGDRILDGAPTQRVRSVRRPVIVDREIREVDRGERCHGVAGPQGDQGVAGPDRLYAPPDIHPCPAS